MTTINRKHGWPLALLLGTVLALPGCETLSEPVQSLAGASAMRVEVEVYKGPLADDVMTQWGDLIAAVTNAASGLDLIGKQYGPIIEEFRRRAFKVHPEASGNIATSIVGQLYKARDRLNDASRSAVQSLLLSQESPDRYQKVVRSIDIGVPGPGNETSADRVKADNLVGALYEVSYVAYVAGQMLPESQALLRQLAVELPSERATRKAYATLANAYCQYGNQILSRADALTRELRGLEQERFSTGAMIRNTKPCATLDAFVWFNAFDPPLATEVLGDPVAGIFSDERRDRVRALERLFADLNWSHVNTVYAAGQGKTTMALIRDQYGNWDLKAFENDPTKLLEAYTNLAKAALSTAADVASGGTTLLAKDAVERVAAVNKLVDLAQTSEAGDIGNTEGSAVTLSPAIIAGGRRFLLEQLEQIRTQAGLPAGERAAAAAAALAAYKRHIETLQESVVAATLGKAESPAKMP